MSSCRIWSILGDKIAAPVAVALPTVFGMAGCELMDKYTEQQRMGLIAIFQIMIAHYGWSVPGLHNNKLFKKGETRAAHYRAL